MTECLQDLAKLMPSWKLALRAERKSPATVKSWVFMASRRSQRVIRAPSRSRGADHRAIVRA